MGDFCPGDHYFTQGHGAGSLTPDERVESVTALAGILADSDWSILNLEGCLSSTSHHSLPWESTFMRGSPDWARTLFNAGVRCVNVANNHSLQHGEAAFWNTVHACSSAGLQVVGLATASGLPVPLHVRIADENLIVIAFSSVTDPRKTTAQTYANTAASNVLEMVSHFSERGNVLVYMHAGVEATTRPDREVVADVEALRLAGASIVAVHHSHVFQGVEIREGAVCCFGLGDLFMDLFWHRMLVESAVVLLELREDRAKLYNILPVCLSPSPLKLNYTGPSHALPCGEKVTASSYLQQEVADGKNETLTWLQLRKAMYFLTNLHRGHTKIKLRFAIHKLLSRVGFSRQPLILR